MPKLIPLYILFFMASACASSVQMIKFPRRPNETFTNNSLKEYFRTHKAPEIVLRIPAGIEKAGGNSSREQVLLYNTIEKELLKQGFTVRDRNQSGLAAQADLVLELVNLDQGVVYTTNNITYISKKGERQEPGNIDYKRYGATVEFRLILAQTNEFAGTYKYNYQPCLDGCALGSFAVTGSKDARKVQLPHPIAFNTMEEFIKFSVQDMAKALRAVGSQ
jgi:hypothetical protein